MLSSVETKNTTMRYLPGDRRHSTRHRLRGRPLAINPRILGPILNISLHGMLFEYSGEELVDTPFMEMGIFICESKTLVTGIRTRTVRDYISDTCSSFIPVIRKIRAVEFLDLSPQQQNQLHQIISTLAANPL